MKPTETKPKHTPGPCICGSDAEVKVTSGGFNYYYAVHCRSCERNSRGLGNLLPQLFSTNSPNTPQTSREEAIKAWDKINQAAIAKATGGGQ